VKSQKLYNHKVSITPVLVNKLKSFPCPYIKEFSTRNQDYPMTEYTINVNQENFTVDVDNDTPLLWVLRDSLSLTGTKYSCGMGLCGSCTVLIDGEPTRSCITPVASAVGVEIITIEGLSPDGSHPVQKAWMEEHVTQCGYCQPGQIMNAAALLRENPNPSDSDIDNAMKNVLCRCGTYQRIRKAIHTAAEEA
jgi:isoquinoline 1-oxidoreductase alpha subunit